MSRLMLPDAGETSCIAAKATSRVSDESPQLGAIVIFSCSGDRTEWVGTYRASTPLFFSAELEARQSQDAWLDGTAGLGKGELSSSSKPQTSAYANSHSPTHAVTIPAVGLQITAGAWCWTWGFARGAPHQPKNGIGERLHGLEHALAYQHGGPMLGLVVGREVLGCFVFFACTRVGHGGDVARAGRLSSALQWGSQSPAQSERVSGTRKSKVSTAHGVTHEENMVCGGFKPDPNVLCTGG
ncbi:hypothetical protein H4582DRAFT_2126940 [Lactarius indigo]|nr:hypothetical protein H4582DRAFT_2126940 [Lactarius indigo]